MLKFLKYSLVVILLGLNHATWSSTIGGVDTAGLDTLFDFNPSLGANGGWQVGDPNNRQVVVYDPSAGPWIKQLDLTGLDPNNTFFFIEEYLQVGGTTAWTDWHEESLSPSWEFISAAKPQVFLNGIDITAQITASILTGLDIFFDPNNLPQPGDTVDIFKRIEWTNVSLPTPNTGLIEIAEFPTVGTTNGVPNPGVLWLFGVGLLSLVTMRKLKNPQPAI